MIKRLITSILLVLAIICIPWVLGVIEHTYIDYFYGIPYWPVGFIILFFISIFVLLIICLTVLIKNYIKWLKTGEL